MDGKGKIATPLKGIILKPVEGISFCFVSKKYRTEKKNL